MFRHTCTVILDISGTQQSTRNVCVHILEQILVLSLMRVTIHWKYYFAPGVIKVLCLRGRPTLFRRKNW